MSYDPQLISFSFNTQNKSLEGTNTFIKKIQLQDFAKTVKQVKFSIEVQLLRPEPRIWLQPSLKKQLFEHIDVEFGRETIIILPGAKRDVKYNGDY